MQNVVGEMVVRVGVDTLGLDKGLAAGQSKMKSFATGLGKMSKAMMMGTTLPIAAMGVAVTKMAMDFETQMTDVFTLMDDATIKSKDWSQAVLDLSREVPQSTEVLSRGLYNVVSAGIDAASAMDVLKVAAKAASAGLADTDISVKAITAVLNAYNLEASEAENVSDILFTTVRYGVTTFPELASAIGRVISTASAANVSFEEVGASLITMTKAGMSTDEAVTALNQVIMNFLSPTDQAVAAAAKVGYRLDAVTLSTKGLGGAMAELIESFGITIDDLVELERQGYSDEEMFDALAVRTGISASAFAEVFGNIRALKGAFALMSNEGLNFAEAQEQMAGKSNAMSDAFAKQAETTKFAFDLAMSSVKATMVELGQKFLPKVTEIFNAIGKGADKFGELDDATLNSIIAWAGLLAILPLVGMAVSKTITGIIGLRTALGSLNAVAVVPALGSLLTLIPTIGTAAGLAALNINYMNSAFMGSETVLTKLKKDNPFWWLGSITDITDALSGGLNPKIEALNDAFVTGKISQDAYGRALADLTNKETIADKWGMARYEYLSKESDVIDQITDGTYELTMATEEQANSIEDNTKSIMDYRFANEELIATLQQIENEYSAGRIKADDYEKAVAFLASTNGQYKGSIKDVYNELGIMTAEQLGLEEAIPGTTEVLSDQLDVVVDLAEGFDALLKNMFELYNLNQSVTETGWAYEDSLKALNEVLKNTSATEREVQEAIFGVQNAREDYVSSIMSEMGAEDLTAARRQELINLYTQLGLAAIEAGETSSTKFLEIAKAAGITKTELRTAIDEIGADIETLPKEIKTKTDIDKKQAEENMGAMFGMFTIYEESDPTAEVAADIEKADTSMGNLDMMMQEYERSNPQTKVYADTKPAWDSINYLSQYQIPAKTIPLKYGIPGYAHGGQVPGPAGVPRPAIVHGGEWVVNPFEPKSVSQFIDAMAGNKTPQAGTIINKFEIATLIVREEADTQKIARDLLDMQQQEQRSLG